ncbi:MAG TPA: ATP-binding domain-containing protein, partial [Mycobacteriales bacterium]
ALRVCPAGSELAATVLAEVRAALDTPGSVAVICADAAVPVLTATLTGAGLAFASLAAVDAERPTVEPRLSLVPAGLAKGLEFDHVVLVEPADIVAAESTGLARLYVALTRAVSRLVVVHHGELPAELLG